MKAIIFGGGGFIGSHVADELTRRDFEVIVADLEPSVYLQESQTYMACDITNSTQVNKIITDDVDIVYNFAAIADLDDSIHDPVKTIQINVLGNLNLLEACRHKSVSRFIYASSAYALSNDGSFYGISKHTSEKLVEEYYARYGLKYTIIRYGSLYGERADEHNYIYCLLRDALLNKEITYRGDGKEIREYIHVADTAKLSVDILQDEQYVNEHIILTGVEKLQRIELLNMIQEIITADIKIIQSSSDYMGHYKITPYAFQPTLAKKLTANPFIDLGQGLVNCLKNISEELNSNNTEI